MCLMPRSVKYRHAAHAPFGAFAAASVLLFLGLVGMFMTFGLVVITADIGLSDPGIAPLTRTATALVAGFGGCALGGLGGLLLAGQSKAGIGHDGQFRVRSWPPWRVRAVDLGMLQHIGSARGPVRRRGLLAATRHSTTLSLRDQGGRSIEWNPAFWRGSEAVVTSLRAAAFDVGATVDPGALRVLDDPPFGGD